MNDTEKKKLQIILRTLDALRKDVEELLGGETPSTSKKAGIGQEARSLIDNINALSSSELEIQLERLDHKDLGEIFIAVGGSSGDKRKPKAWLIERIVWLAKEFSEGHKAIRDS